MPEGKVFLKHILAYGIPVKCNRKSEAYFLSFFWAAKIAGQTIQQY